jgi:hypothetical protein
MKRYFVLFIFQFWIGSALAESINVNVGGTPLVIPVPTEFKAVDPGMMQLNKLINSMTFSENTLLASFIPEKSFSAAQLGVLPDLTRYLSLQANKATINQDLSDADFAGLKQYFRNQNAELAKQVNEQATDALKQASNKLSAALDNPVNLKSGGIEMLPMHEDTSRVLAFSMRINIGTSDTLGKPTTEHSLVTVTIVHVKDKFLLLYVNGSQDDLEWTRNIAKNWADAILAANPSNAIASIRESAQSGGFDWNELCQHALIGAIIGGFIGLAMSIDKKRKKRKLEQTPPKL